MIRLFSTKQLSPTQRQAFTSAGFSLEMEDFIEILPVAPIGAIPQADYFLFSSQNTLLSLAQNPYYAQLPHKRAFCVGEKSRQLLEQMGWEVLASFDYAKDLAPFLVEHYAQASFVFFCGAQRMNTLPNTLRAHHISLQEYIVYHTALTPKRLESPYDALLFFSPSAIESYLKDNEIGREKLICIGETTYAALPKGSQGYIAPRPTIEGVLECCMSLFDN